MYGVESFFEFQLVEVSCEKFHIWNFDECSRFLFVVKDGEAELKGFFSLAPCTECNPVRGFGGAFDFKGIRYGHNNKAVALFFYDIKEERHRVVCCIVEVVF